MAWRLKRPLITVSCHDDLTASDLVGRYLVKGGETVWMDGPLARAVRPGEAGYVAEVLARYSGLVKHLRKTFEAMRDENRVEKRQVQGDEVDIDALVEALADARDGSEMSDRLFTRMHRSERNIVVMFMVDMSGST